MSLIEGVGDEVTDFFIVMTVLLVGWLAWCSTSIADQPLIRTVLILRDRTPTRITSVRANQQQSTNNLSVQDAVQSHNSETSEEETVETSNNSVDGTQSNCPNAAADTSESPQEVSRPTESTTAEEVLIEAMDSFNNSDPSLLQRTKTSSASP